MVAIIAKARSMSEATLYHIGAAVMLAVTCTGTPAQAARLHPLCTAPSEQPSEQHSSVICLQLRQLIAESTAHSCLCAPCRQMREVRDSKQAATAAIPVLLRLAALVEDNDEMRSYFIAAGGAPRLAQLTAADNPPLKGGFLLPLPCQPRQLTQPAPACACVFSFAGKAPGAVA